jgi:hypothetical protein
MDVPGRGQGKAATKSGAVDGRGKETGGGDIGRRRERAEGT